MLHLLLQIIPVLCCRDGFPDLLGPRNGSSHCLGVLGGGPPRLALKAALLLRLLTLGDMGRANLGLSLVLAFAAGLATATATLGVLRISTVLILASTSTFASGISAA